MNAKRLIVLLMAAVFTFGVVGLSLAAEEVKGTVTKIEGTAVTIKDDTGGQTVVEVKDQKSLMDIQVGDKVSVKGNKLKKEGK